MNHVIKNTNQHVDVKKFGENWDLIYKKKIKKTSKKHKKIKAEKKKEYNPFCFIKY